MTRHPVRQASIARALFVLMGTTVSTTLVLRLLWAVGSGSLGAVLETGPDSPADLLVLGVCALGVAVTGWLGTTALIATLAALPGVLGRRAAQLADRLAPAAVRRTVALALGTALVAGIPAVAHADSPRPSPAATSVAPAPAPDPSFTVTGPAPAVDGGATPTSSPTTTTATTATTATASTGAPDPGFSVTSERADTGSGGPPPRTAPSLGPLGPAPRSRSTPSAADPSSSVRVVRGDSLWRIAERHLGPGATAAQIAREWPRWYAANRAVVGANPHLIRVGQVLTPPPAPTEGAGS